MNKTGPLAGKAPMTYGIFIAFPEIIDSTLKRFRRIPPHKTSSERIGLSGKHSVEAVS